MRKTIVGRKRPKVARRALQSNRGLIGRILNWLLKLDPVSAVIVRDNDHYDPRMWRQ